MATRALSSIALVLASSTGAEPPGTANADDDRCNVTGTWCWHSPGSPPAPGWRPFAWREDGAGGFTFSASPVGQPGAPWRHAVGRLFRNQSLTIDYGCGPSFPCVVAGFVDRAGGGAASCDRVTIDRPGGASFGEYSRCRPVPPPPPLPPPPVLPEPRSFDGDARWLAEAAVFVLGSSQQRGSAGTTSTIFTPNMQPGGASCVCSHAPADTYAYVTPKCPPANLPNLAANRA